MAAKKKPLDIKPVTAGQGSLEVLSMTLPPDRPPGRIVGEGPDAVPELVRLLRTEAKAI
jgi:electron transfer flavoprotein beta subunit